MVSLLSLLVPAEQIWIEYHSSISDNRRREFQSGAALASEEPNDYHIANSLYGVGDSIRLCHSLAHLRED